MTTSTLPFGIRIIYLPTAGSGISHLGLVIDAGSRDETEEEIGMAHFVEHMLFKGTKKRKSLGIISRMDSVGAELNAYTTKEKTCLYSTFQTQYLGRAAELIADIAFHSNYPKEEMEKEKKVITDEIFMYRDNPEESIFDDFLSLQFVKHPLGNNILGSPESISKFSPKKLHEFTKRNYQPIRMVLAVASPLPFDKVVKVLEKYFGELQTKKKQMLKQVQHDESIVSNRTLPRFVKPFTKTEKKDFTQSHCIIGGKALDVHHPKRHALMLLSNVLGGPGMNSKLGLAIREKKGYTYSVYSDVNSYTDSGLFSIYFGCDNKYLEKCKAIAFAELKKLRDNKPGTMQLHKAITQYCGQLAVAEENKASLMISLANGLLDKGTVPSLEEVIKKIQNISPSAWLEAANEVFDEKRLSTLAYLGE